MEQWMWISTNLRVRISELFKYQAFLHCGMYMPDASLRFCQF